MTNHHDHPHRIKLSDGTWVRRQEPGTDWTDGKSRVMFPDTAEVVVEVVHDTDARLQVMLDDQGNVVEGG